MHACISMHSKPLNNEIGSCPAQFFFFNSFTILYLAYIINNKKYYNYIIINNNAYINELTDHFLA